MAFTWRAWVTSIRAPCVVVSNVPIRGVIAFFVFLLPTLWRLTAFPRLHQIDLVSLEYLLAWVTYIFLVRLWTPIKVTGGLHGDDVLSLHMKCRHEQWLVKHMIRR